MARQIWLDGHLTLDDIIADDLDVLFSGYNPSLLAVEQQHYYARKANRFWEDLHEVGLVSEVLRGPDADLRLLEFGLGLTDMIKRPSPNIDGLTAEEYRLGVARLDRLVARHRPRILCFNGLGLLAKYQAWGRPAAGLLVLAVPSTSPRNNGLRAKRLEAFRDLKAHVEALRA